ncbi:MAG: TetR/AcrR family transcriptional regulator [Gammaproteobacteria bacterium]|nr:TetR/AcrR family transcriptional regulator [Gammaproteobacteria bacterium]
MLDSQGGSMALKRKGQEFRQHIVETANRLFYRRGYNQTSFTDIADAAEIPRGNFYYYFKTKDEILDAVVDYRLDGIRAMLAEWDASIPEPRDRLKRYVQILLNEEQDILRYGCPMGTLNVELSKTQLVLQSRSREMFEVFFDWLKAQFLALSCGRAAREHALHLLAVTQGVSLLTNTFEDAALLRKEAVKLKQWIDEI